MARSGPITTDTSTVPLGLAQIRVGSSPGNIASTEPVLSSSDSMGAMASTKFIGNTDWYKLESGFPLGEDLSIVIREAAALECAFKQLTPYNMAIAYGIAASGSGEYSEVHSGEVKLGGRCAPEYVRMEAVYTYPRCTVTNHLYIIFPRAQVVSSVEVDFQAEEVANVPITFESKNSSSDVTGGNAAWDNKPLGRFFWD